MAFVDKLLPFEKTACNGAIPGLSDDMIKLIFSFLPALPHAFALQLVSKSFKAALKASLKQGCFDFWDLSRYKLLDQNLLHKYGHSMRVLYCPDVERKVDFASLCPKLECIMVELDKVTIHQNVNTVIVPGWKEHEGLRSVQMRFPNVQNVFYTHGNNADNDTIFNKEMKCFVNSKLMNKLKVHFDFPMEWLPKCRKRLTVLHLLQNAVAKGLNLVRVMLPSAVQLFIAALMRLDSNVSAIEDIQNLVETQNDKHSEPFMYPGVLKEVLSSAQTTNSIQILQTIVHSDKCFDRLLLTKLCLKDSELMFKVGLLGIIAFNTSTYETALASAIKQGNEEDVIQHVMNSSVRAIC